MRTKLNKKVNAFFRNPIDNINYEAIKSKFFEEDKNEYGNLLHAVVQNKFDEEKVLKFIECLLENGYDVNYKGKSTGYNFIQLALYGYTDDFYKEDYSYSERFILKLINIAKKYNLDVNTKDNDGDSIVHTAMASEVYEGRIIPILDALGEEFDINCRDNRGNNLEEALDRYIRGTLNKQWSDRLARERLELINRFKKEKLRPKSRVETTNSLMKSDGSPIKDIIEQEKAITKEMEIIMEKLNLDYLINNKSIIFQLKNKLSSILNKKSLLTNKENEYENIWNKYNELLRKVFLAEINKLQAEENINKLQDLISTLEEYEFNEEIEVINKIIENYNKKIANLKHKIETELTIENKEKLISEIVKLKSKDKEELQVLLKQFEEKLLLVITELKEQEKLFIQRSISIEEIDYNNLTLVELKIILEQNNEIILKIKEDILNEKQQKLNYCVKEILDLEQTGMFEKDELWDVIKSIMPEQNKVKVRKKVK